MPHDLTTIPYEEAQKIRLEGRRAARLTFARRRIQKILEGQPALTREQRAQLALEIYPEGFTGSPK